MKKFLVPLMVAVIALQAFGLDQSATGGSPLSSTPLWAAAEAKKDKVVIVSDIHLGIVDKYSENLKNRAVFIEFLRRLGNKADVGELVIAGDFLDEWYLPLTYLPYSDSGEFYRQVVKNNQPLFDELNALIAKGIKLTYVPGNHDMTLESDILAQALPGVNQARDARGMGKHYTGFRNEILIEHGHRYDVFSAPDSVSNKDITGDELCYRCTRPHGSSPGLILCLFGIKMDGTVRCLETPETTFEADQALGQVDLAGTVGRVHRVARYLQAGESFAQFPVDRQPPRKGDAEMRRARRQVALEEVIGIHACPAQAHEKCFKNTSIIIDAAQQNGLAPHGNTRGENHIDFFQKKRRKLLRMIGLDHHTQGFVLFQHGNKLPVHTLGQAHRCPGAETKKDAGSSLP